MSDLDQLPMQLPMRAGVVRPFVIVFALALVFSRLLGGSHPSLVHARSTPRLTPAVIAATYTFDPTIPALDRQAVLDAVASARPEAQRLLALVDGAVHIHVGPTGVPIGGGQAVGYAKPSPDHYDVQLDLGPIFRTSGKRGVRAVVLHELGHVVDFALLNPELREQLALPVAIQLGCGDGIRTACANERERFAETFRKWATGDLGDGLYQGYEVPPPPQGLEPWGQPLLTLQPPTD